MTPGYVLGCLLQIWVCAVGALLAFRMLTGHISLNGLFTIDGARFSPERLQLFIMLLAALVVYAERAIRAGAMPPLPDELLMLLGGSNLIYLAGKVIRPPQ